MTAKRIFWLAVALQVLILLGIVGRHQYTLATGTPILLKTAPVDPWDPFRGDYVRLNYEISSLTKDKVAMTGSPYRRGQSVWVTVAKGQEFWSAVAVSDKRPAVQNGQVALRAIVEFDNSAWDPAPGEPRTMPQLFVRYGIEQFYVPEGEGKDLETRQRDMTVQALVDRFGRAALHKVFVEGKEIQWR